MAMRGRPPKRRRLGPAISAALRELAQEKADAWNAAVPVRSLVRPKGTKGPGRPTLMFAQVLGVEAVVWVSGVAGCVLIDSLEVVEKKGNIP